MNPGRSSPRGQDNESGPFSDAANMRIPKRGPGRPSVIVCNHIGFIEIMNLIASPLCPGFTPKADLKHAPLMGALCGGLQSLFLNRAGTKEEREGVV